jgi:hypothetical protein
MACRMEDELSCRVLEGRGSALCACLSLMHCICRGDALPDTTPTTRLMLVGDAHVGLLSAMFVSHGGLGACACAHACSMRTPAANTNHPARAACSGCCMYHTCLAASVSL